MGVQPLYGSYLYLFVVTDAPDGRSGTHNVVRVTRAELDHRLGPPYQAGH